MGDSGTISLASYKDNQFNNNYMVYMTLMLQWFLFRESSFNVTRGHEDIEGRGSENF